MTRRIESFMYVLIFTTLVGLILHDLNREVTEHVDLIELNHFHDCLGRHVYDQVIFYEWSHEHSVYHVRAWCLVEDRDILNRRPVKRYSDGSYIVYWQDRDQNILRVIDSTKYRESWTMQDPERANKKILDERLRTVLVKRSLPKQAEPEPELFESPLDELKVAQ